MRASAPVSGRTPTISSCSAAHQWRRRRTPRLLRGAAVVGEESWALWAWAPASGRNDGGGEGRKAGPPWPLHLRPRRATGSEAETDTDGTRNQITVLPFNQDIEITVYPYLKRWRSSTPETTTGARHWPWRADLGSRGHGGARPRPWRADLVGRRRWGRRGRRAAGHGEEGRWPPTMGRRGRRAAGHGEEGAGRRRSEAPPARPIEFGPEKTCLMQSAPSRTRRLIKFRGDFQPE